MSARPLFPASTSPRALEELAAHAWEGPTYREDREEADAERREGRCCHLAAEAFEDCTDIDVHEWLARDENREDVLTLAVACIQQDDDMRRYTLRELLSRYVDQCSGKYMDAVMREEERDREDALEARR